MADSPLPTWKYDHEFPQRRPGGPSGVRILASAVLGAALVTAGVLVLGFGPADLLARPVRALAALLAFAAVTLVLSRFRAGQRKCISVGRRYLVCGSQIVYFGNVTAAALDERHGRLQLTTVFGGCFLLEQRRFPTNARKADKIARNTGAKFTKVATRILTAVQQASPGAVITHTGR